MISRLVTAIAGISCFAGAFALAPPLAADLHKPAQWLVRPAVLPFAWRDLQDATRTGDATEAFARAQRIAQLLPSWTDGQIVFAYRFATDAGNADPDAAGRGEAAWRRLQAALAWLEAARSTAGDREVELLQAMAMLPEVAVGQQPALAERLREAGGAAALGDHYLRQAEELTASLAVREQRTFLTVQMAAGLLALDPIAERPRAILVLETGIRRSRDVRDRELATEWARRLELVVRHLRGEEVDLGAVRADRRMAPLLPFLR